MRRLACLILVLASPCAAKAQHATCSAASSGANASSTNSVTFPSEVTTTVSFDPTSCGGGAFANAFDRFYKITVGGAGCPNSTFGVTVTPTQPNQDVAVFRTDAACGPCTVFLNFQPPGVPDGGSANPGFVTSIIGVKTTTSDPYSIEIHTNGGAGCVLPVVIETFSVE
jgi:hypothetical protein